MKSKNVRQMKLTTVNASTEMNAQIIWIESASYERERERKKKRERSDPNKLKMNRDVKYSMMGSPGLFVALFFFALANIYTHISLLILFSFPIVSLGRFVCALIHIFLIFKSLRSVHYIKSHTSDQQPQ